MKITNLNNFIHTGVICSSRFDIPSNLMLISLLASDILNAYSTDSPIILLMPFFWPSI